MRMNVLIGLAALVGLAGVAPPVAAQEVTAQVRTWSGESWRLMQPSLEVFYTIMPKGKTGGMRERTGSIESAVGTDILAQTQTRELEAPEPDQGHKRTEIVTLFREGAETQIPLGRIESLQFFRQRVEKSPLPPYVAATHFRYFATAVLVDGSRVEGDYVNLGTTVLRGMTPQGRVDIPWEEVENVRFEPAGIPKPTSKETEVALVPSVPEPPAPTPKEPVHVKRQITPLKEAPKVPQPTAEEQKVVRPSAVAEPPVSTPKVPAPVKPESAPLKEAPEVSKPSAKEEAVALVPAFPKPPVPTPQVPKLVKRDVVFDFDSLLLSEDAKGVLNAFGKWLKAIPDAKVIMEGHCDKRERGTSAYNFALGELRLNAIRDYLVDAGIHGRRISTATAGEEPPVVLGHDGTAWKCNRRVHLEMVKVEGPVRQLKKGRSER